MNEDYHNEAGNGRGARRRPARGNWRQQAAQPGRQANENRRENARGRGRGRGDGHQQHQNRPRRDHVFDRLDNDGPRGNPNYRARDEQRNDFQRDGNVRRIGAQARNDGGADERQKNRSDRCMGFRNLEEIARSNNQDIILKISERKTSFVNLLESEIDKGDLIVLIMEIISKVCLSSFDELKSKLLLEICNSRFITSLRNYILDLPYVEVKARNNLYWSDQKKFWVNFIAFCECIVNISPSTAVQKCRSLIDVTSKCCLDALRDRHDFILDDEYNVRLSHLRERLTLCEKEEKEKVETRQKLNTNSVAEDSEPPDDFRNLSVLPSRDDLLDHRPFLRPNIANGGYRDTEHYLDVQFRLLREDCFGPLRDGISQYIENPTKKKYDNIRVYHNVKFIEPYISSNKLGEMIQLDEKTIKRFKRINWAHSKRFIFGSLLLFTKDNCRSFITATILEREVKLLNQGKIPVSIVDKIAGGNVYSVDSTFTMIESEVYFEPYFHVLKALQDVNFPEDLAMKKYIVHVDPNPVSPGYLNPDAIFTVKTEYQLNAKFRVLDPHSWPTMIEMGFNESQYEAYRLALTHEFAVIQGPPGTGKTFLGVKIAKTLLDNIKPGNKQCIMLVICYTNHALDQFLENILPVTQSIVRIGGQSRNENMKNLNLTTLRQTARVNYNAKRLFFEQKNNLKLAVRELQSAQERVEVLNNSIISYNSLKDYVPEVQIVGQYYANYRDDVKTDPLLHWLFERMDRVAFNNVMKDIKEEVNNDNVNEIYDNDVERIEMILDDFDDEFVRENEDDNLYLNAEERPISTSFSVTDVESKLKSLVLLYSKINNRHKQNELVIEIVDLKSRINLFQEMAAYRTRETRLPINNRTDLGVVSKADRWLIYFRWANIVISNLKQRMRPLQEALDSASTAYEESRMMVDLQILNNIKVVGMTTSGAARLRKLLIALAPPIVIVEEAAEVLEQHIVTSLTKSCEHLILIGDHQQLRPSAAHIRLARHFNIEISLFERMITNGMHSRRLSVQHRMRPEFAALISPHIYEDLRNHPTVEQFPRVRGMADNLFFLTHNFKEEEVDDSSSRSNQLEADMTLKLGNYLMQQGYKPEEVTILAAYSGQMFYMRKQRDNYAFLAKVKITVVDNYQGEESKIILLSLVRNNNQNKIGFLGTENRVCVALSRAREGFYIFGNIDILKRNSGLWQKIATTLENNSSLGTSIILKCARHPDQITTISSPNDFDKVPEGGCLLKCDHNLPCGHRCPLICHGYDSGHVNTKCYLQCERVLCDLGHVCPSLCWVECQPCKRLVQKVLPCGHKMQVYCYKDPTDPSVKCLTTVKVTLPTCGHEVKKSCFMETASMKCPVPCVYTVKCGHTCQMKCHVSEDPEHNNYVCDKACARAKKGCKADLVGDRGDHQCRKRCHEACDNCTVEVVKKRSKCTHSERVACNINLDDKPCIKKCTRALPCTHHCKKKCYEPCGDCTQKVTKTIEECNHKAVVMCKEPATRQLCKERCERTLSCGHACARRCAEPCAAAACAQPVAAALPAPCGHRVHLPCNVYEAHYGAWSEELLLQHCREPCLRLLACEHFCGGSCSGCHQGRLHEPCTQTCHQLNICGHQCNEPCNQACPPCNKPCATKCPHGRCNLLCGAPCYPCQESCARSCEHGACTNRCGEPCSRAPCDAACARPLPCGHRCRGLCGEPCPDVCRQCRPDDFPRDFLGDEYDDDTKFIRLEDCTHVLDVENMDNMMMGDKETIAIRTCPYCRAPVINTYRYKDLVNQMFRLEINPVKEKVYGNEEIIKRKREELFLKVIAFCDEHEDVFRWNTNYKTAVEKLLVVVKKQRKVSLLKIDMQFQFLEILDMIAECYRKYAEANLRVMETELIKLVNLLCSVLDNNLQKISQQLQHDVGNEIKRMNSIIQLARIKSNASYLSLKMLPNVKEAETKANDVVLSHRIFNQNDAMLALKQLQEAVKVSGIVTKEERDLVIKAIGSKAGSWYKCPNGHVYSIGQCGGAMEVSRCADCGAAIGGTSHSLLQNNAHAGEVDGSRFAAWSNEYNNMANWRI